MNRLILLLAIVFLFVFPVWADDGNYVEKKLQVHGTDSIYLVTVKLSMDTTDRERYKMGMLDEKENELLPPVYDYIKRNGNSSVFTLILGKKIGLYSIKGREILPVEYDGMDYLVDNCFTIRRDTKMGVFDEKQERLIIPVEYDWIEYKDSGIEPVRITPKGPPPSPKTRRVVVYKGENYSNRKPALLDLYTGETIIPFGKYDYIEYSDKYSFMNLWKRDSGWEVIDYSGKIQLTGSAPTYAQITPYGFIVIEDVSKNTFVPLKGKKMDVTYNHIIFRDNGLAVVAHKDEETDTVIEGVINSEGKVVIEPKYQFIHITTDAIYVEKDEKIGVFDLDGKMLFSPDKYDYIEYYPDTKVAVVAKEMEEYTSYGLVNLKDKVLIPIKYWNIYYADGIARIITHRIGDGHKHGMYNVRTKKLLPPIYDGMDGFVNGVAVIGYFSAEGNKYGLLDKDGKELVTPVYETMFFNDAQEYATVTLDRKQGMIGAKGEVLVPVIFDRFTEYRPENDKNGLVVGEKDGKFAAYNFHTGKEILPLGYEFILRLYNGLMYRVDGKNHYCDENGKEISAPK